MLYSFSEGVYNICLYIANLGKGKVECSICGERFYSYMSDEERLKCEAEGIKNYYCSEGCMMTLLARSESEKILPEDQTKLVTVHCGICNKEVFLCLSPNDLKLAKTYFCKNHR
jgi:hypothetical protein